jgi:glycosyltransferase involved in cell wall biosynthesis
MSLSNSISLPDPGYPTSAVPHRAADPRVSVIIPTKNEEENLPFVLPALPQVVDEVVIVDAGSRDDTVAVALHLRPDARIVYQTGMGKGNAVACGLAAASGEILVMLDADGSTDPGEIPAFVEALLAGADFAKGSRYMGGGGSEDLTHIRRWGNACLVGLVNMLFRVRYTDLCYGYNAFWRKCLPALAVDCAGFEVETLVNIRAAKAGYAIAEVPSVERERIHGLSNLHPVRDGLRILRTIIRERLSGGSRVHDPAWAALAGELLPLEPADLVLEPADLVPQLESGLAS